MIELLEETPTSGVEATIEERGMLQRIQQALSQAALAPKATAALVGPDGKSIPLPEPLFQILRYAAGMLLRGERITLASVTKDLSTQEAADLLGVSRPHLIKLLDNGEIPFTKTGRNRRVRFGDINDFRKQRDTERRERLRHLIRQTEELGLYDMEEFDLASTR
jgi:excisionase family DNA binding protein